MEKSKNKNEQLGQSEYKKSKKLRKLFKWLIILLLIILLILLLLFWPYKKTTATNCQNLDKVTAKSKPSNPLPPVEVNEGDPTYGKASPSGSIEETNSNLPTKEEPEKPQAEQVLRDDPTPQIQNPNGGSSWDLNNPFGVIRPNTHQRQNSNFYIIAPPTASQTINYPPTIVDPVEEGAETPIINNPRHRPDPGQINSQEPQSNQNLPNPSSQEPTGNGENQQPVTNPQGSHDGGQDGLSGNQGTTDQTSNNEDNPNVVVVPTGGVGDNSQSLGSSGSQQPVENNPNNEDGETTNTDTPTNSESSALPEPTTLVNPVETSNPKKKGRKQKKQQKKKAKERAEAIKEMAENFEEDEEDNGGYILGFFANRLNYHAAKIGETYGGDGELTAVIFNITWNEAEYHIKLTPDKLNHYWHIKSYDVFEDHKQGTFYWNDKSIKGVFGNQVRAEKDPVKIRSKTFIVELVPRPDNTHPGRPEYSEDEEEVWKAKVRKSRKTNKEDVLRDLKTYLNDRTGASVVGQPNSI